MDYSYAYMASLVSWFDQSTLTELEYTQDATRLRLVRSSAQVSSGQADAPVSIPATSQSIHEESVAEPTPVSASVRQILSGMAGTFFRRPAPDQPTFVEVGSVIREGQTVALVEAMKMLNAVEAECGGRVLRIAAEDGAMVSTGDLLLEIAPVESTDV